MSNGHATGSVTTRPTARGDVYYAIVRFPGRKQTTRRLGFVWGKRTRPPAGYLTESMAAARLAAIVAGDDPIVNVEPVTVTFGRAVDEWLTDRARELRDSTMHDYRGVAKRLRSHFGEDTALGSIDVDRVNAFRDELLEEGLSGRTANKILTALHGVLRLAMERHHLPANPVAVVRKAKQRHRKLEQYLTAPEIAQLVAKAPTAQEAVLYEVAAWTGLRWGELRALRWGDVRFTDGLVYVNRNWPVHGAEGETKSGKPRSVPLDDDVAASLDALSRREHFTDDDDYVFVNEVGDPLGYDWTVRRFKVARDAAKLTSPRANDRELTLHDLRHTYGTLAAAIYRDLRLVQQYMGHASITTTELYAHFLPQTDAAARATAGRRAMLGDAVAVQQPVQRVGT